MDIDKVVLKTKMNAKGTHHIAYCEEYPSIQGIGPSEGQAIANFWKGFNSAEMKSDEQANKQKKAELKAQELQNTKKKAA